MPSLTPEIAAVLIALVAGKLVLSWLRVIGSELDRSVRWHALRVEVQRLRHEQAERIAAMEREHERAKEARREKAAEMEAAAGDEEVEAVEIAEVVPDGIAPALAA
ncbi:MAG: hypothetical protein HKO59_09035 [Phycisphaerales bacterium]|nr:hypothetical protein [Phycisphaerae bacterium]NNF45086.1 hypothetical protein [Phycisphaerales bacterium]NNM26113.1 hypothetical protein [Phycisphaerales bacterium]